jgi:RNase P protein component
VVESSPSPNPFTYSRHKPEESVLYRVIQNNWLGFQGQVLRETGHPLPDFVVKEFEEYLRCGILAHGFLRVQCEKCHQEHLVAFSCKRRGFCPSCGGRRMTETAAHLVDSVLPLKPIRQWVISFPFPIRLCLAVRPKIMAKALDITHTTISAYYRKKANLPKPKSKTGAVTLIQRFGGSLNLNVHFHQLFIDGTYELSDHGEPLDFYAAGPPTLKDLEPVLSKIIKRLTRYLEKQKIIVKDSDNDFQLSIPEEDSFSRLQASSVTYRFATGASKGKKAMVLKSVPDADHSTKAGLVVKNSGFSLHAGVATKAHERDRLERLCRYIARPALSEERLSTNVRGEIIYKLKKPWDDGTTAVKFTPMELMEKLAALVPRPRVHLTRFHGVLAPHYKFRKQIVPKKPELSQPLALVQPDQIPKPGPKRMSWARLLKRVFNIDISICPKCQGRMRILAAIEDPKIIRKILDHLGIPSSPPQLGLPRGPPESQQEDHYTQDFPEY